MQKRLGFVVVGAAMIAGLGLSSGTTRDKIDKVVVHTIGGPSCSDAGEVQFRPVRGDAETWKTWFEAEDEKGIHYIVDRVGLALASIPEDQVANHVIGHNKTSIGIELVNRGDGVDPFPDAQIGALVTLLCDILARNSLTASDVTGHQDLDDSMMTCGENETRRKVDPGPLFPWQDVQERVEACLVEQAQLGASPETAEQSQDPEDS